MTRRGPIAWIASLDDGVIIRTAFFLLLAATAAVLSVDYRELTINDVAAVAAPDMPILPAFDPDSPEMPAGPSVTTDPALLKEPLTATLVAGGVLEVSGTVDPGSFERVQAEVAARREYIRTVALDSPGGSVDDAVKIGALLVSEGLDTSVAAGSLCASSCPLMLAGGENRQVSRQAAVGVHQVYAAASPDASLNGRAALGQAMASVQRTTAIITRYLETTGVDPAVWLHALETPPDRLYYLEPEELEKYRLATELID